MGLFGRFALAVGCFFRVLAGKPLPAGFPRDLLPVGLLAGVSAAPQAVSAKSATASAPPQLESPTGAPRGKAEKRSAGAAADGAVQLLSLLQREGRLVDFLTEDIGDYSDEQVGVAVRTVHKGCRGVIAEHFELEAVLKGEEDGPVALEADFSTEAVRLTGNVTGEPPFAGTLVHKGWRAAAINLPDVSEGFRIVGQAEVEM